MSTNADAHISEHWTDEQLREYIRESSGNPFTPAERSQLVAEAANLSRRVEEQAFSGKFQDRIASSSAPPAPAVTSTSGAPARPCAPAIGYPVGQFPPPNAGPNSRGDWQPRPPPNAPFQMPDLPGAKPYEQQPTPAPFVPTGQKRALLCACNYRGSGNDLHGCINDAHCMRHLLCTRFGFLPQNIVMLLDDAPFPGGWPTKANMLWHMQALVANAQPGDSLVFHFSGHGSQEPDSTGDEDDGLNETICPCDFRQVGQINDDLINHVLVNPVPHGVRMHAIIDACHSGSVMDLEFRCKVKSDGIHWKLEYSRRPTYYKGTNGGEVIQFGASRDKQTAADTSQLSGGVSTGAATYAFINAIETWGANISYGALLTNMTTTLNSVQPNHNVGGFGMDSRFDSRWGTIGSHLNRMLDSAVDHMGMSGQRPVMCANWPFDLHRPLAI